MHGALPGDLQQIVLKQQLEFRTHAIAAGYDHWFLVGTQVVASSEEAESRAAVRRRRVRHSVTSIAAPGTNASA